ncbi:hypothetical protein [Acidithiobacillus sp.]|uniref:hypothetical protein n=1 Tax=Acidithiobacillus sp. TaxID=1872118 RepID=UPI002637F06F|nr:hypothetical protein [Acidithiobacillus sp.]MDD2749209.1 hypothetical protein [Acidithiobacillus sp.]MDD5279639.1 hypothetical protein [Acidithiobacillus sp.]
MYIIACGRTVFACVCTAIPLGHFETRYFRDYVWIVGHIGWDYQTALEGFLPWIEQGSLFLLHSARYLPEKILPHWQDLLWRIGK